MTALSKDRKTDQMGTPDVVLPQLLSIPVEAATTIYGGALVAIDSSGYAVPASAASTQRCIGVAQRDVVNTTAAGFGAAAALFVEVHTGVFFYNNGTGVNALGLTSVGSLCYASDDNTVNATDNGGQWPVAGVVMPGGSATNLRSTGSGEVAVLVGFPSLWQANPEVTATAPFVARAVATTIQAYGGTGTGLLTETGTTALSAADGVTLAVGDVEFLPHGLSNVQAADVGPWVVVALGGSGAHWVLQRPDWWVHGAAIPLKAEIAIGPEGTVWFGSTWKATTTGTIDTTDPLFYPVRLMGTGAVGTTVSNLYVRTTAQVSAMDTTAVHAVQPALTAGNGSGTLAFTGTGTDAISWVVFNF